jgi:hypothetical protein
VKAAAAAGLEQRVRSYCGDLKGWAPDVALHAVVCSPAALARLSSSERARVIEVLQSATVDGGVHLVETLAANTDASGGAAATGVAEPSAVFDELRARYRGWSISIDRGRTNTFLARKQAAVA